MILTLTTVADGMPLDNVTVDGERVTYETGRAEPIVRSLRTIMGREKWLDAATDWSNGYVELREASGSVTAAFNPGQRRDDDGRWSDGAPGDAPDVDLDDEEDDEDGPGYDEDEYRNVERFPSRYLRKYGRVVDEYAVGEGDLFVAKTDKGAFHVARGENDRAVLLELDNDKAESLADFVLLYSENQPKFHITDPISGATLRSGGDGGVRIEWPGNGGTTDLSEDGALFLQEGLRSLGPGFTDDDD